MAETNGVPAPASSATINHLTSYPVVSDGIEYFKTHPIGQNAIAYSTAGYDRIVKPFSPYIAKANGFVSPYAHKADSLADSGLTKLDGYFPIVKEPTDTLKGKVTETVGYPRKKAGEVVAYGQGFASEQKDYVVKVYSSEHSKFGEKGVVPAAKAGVTTSIILTAQVVSWLCEYLVVKTDQAKEDASEKVEEAKEVVNEKTS